MFAKLFTTSQGQFLLTADSDDEAHPTLTARYNVQSPMDGAEAVISKTSTYEPTEDGEARRDSDFGALDQEWAEAMTLEGL